jgi:diguanylate cyclase (GGDEF)-like protein
VVGAEIVEQVKFPYQVAPIVRAHHEKWDGSGYPYGLKGEAIPLGARILTAVDSLDALSSDREYRRGLPLEEAMKHISEETGKSFDPMVVRVLERRFRDLERLAKAQLHNMPSLSTQAVITNGHAPAAGLDLCTSGGLTAGVKPLDFLSTIAAAKREGRLLLDVANGLGSSLDLNETLERVEQSLKAMIPHNTLAVFIRRANNLVAEYTSGENADNLLYLEVPAGEGLAGWVAQSAQPVVNGNPAVEPGFTCNPNHQVLSALAVPLEGSHGVVGVMVLYHEETDAFTRDHLRMLLALAPRIGQAVENALKYRETEERANRDRLTQLPNAYLLTRSLDAELARARRMRQPLAVMVCTLDGLQRLCEDMGAAAGEQVLQAVSRALKEDCREYDHLGATAAGEFAFVLPGMKRDCLGAKVTRLGEIAAEADISAGGMISFCIGEAFYPDDGDTARHLLSLAKRRTNQHRQKAAEEAAVQPTAREAASVAATIGG